jgi:hypothetical protein
MLINSWSEHIPGQGKAENTPSKVGRGQGEDA